MANREANTGGNANKVKFHFCLRLSLESHTCSLPVTTQPGNWIPLPRLTPSTWPLRWRTQSQGKQSMSSPKSWRKLITPKSVLRQSWCTPSSSACSVLCFKPHTPVGMFHTSVGYKLVTEDDPRPVLPGLCLGATAATCFSSQTHWQTNRRGQTKSSVWGL